MASSDPYHQPRGAEVLRSRAGADVRLQSLRSATFVPQSGGAGPAAAMAYWGMAMAPGPTSTWMATPECKMKASCAAVDAGLKMAGAPDARRAWLQAARKRAARIYQPQPYIDAMRELAGAGPDDLDAQTLYAESLMIPVRWHWYSRTARRGRRCGSRARPGSGDAALAAIIRAQIICTSTRWNRRPRRSGRSPSAQRLMGIMPWAGHMVHMPGHIWLVVGDYDDGGCGERARRGRRPRVPGPYRRAQRVRDLLRSQPALRGLCTMDGGS